MAMNSSVSSGALFAATGVLNSSVHNDSSTNAAVVVLTVSQPSRDISDTNVGPILPRTPKMARDSVRLGARPRRPADRDNAHHREGAGGTEDGDDDRLPDGQPRNATRVAPSGNPRMLMFAANHTQNSCSGWPWHSPSGTGSMPRVSKRPALGPEVDVLDVRVLLCQYC